MAKKDKSTHEEFHELTNMAPDEIAAALASGDFSPHEKKLGQHAIALLQKKPGSPLNANETAVLRTLVALVKDAKDNPGATPTAHIGFDGGKDAEAAAQADASDDGGPDDDVPAAPGPPEDDEE